MTVAAEGEMGTNSFDNQVFWNSRYEQDPERGSGVGSRGENLVFKRALIADYLLRTRPGSVLDIGCGDHEVLSVLEIDGYTGVDISAVIVSRNLARFPKRKFVHLDIVKEPNPNLVADAVVCMEVLIHQHDRDDYKAMVQAIVALSRSGGLVSGYLDDPRPLIQSPIIAWHEALPTTLEQCGARDVRVEATSLETDRLGFVSFRR